MVTTPLITKLAEVDPPKSSNESPTVTDAEFAEVVEQHREGLVAYVLSRGYAATRGDAEDIVQDVLTTIWARGAYHAFRGDSNVSTWLSQCARRRAIDVMRRRNTPERKEDSMGYLESREDSRANVSTIEGVREIAATVTDPIMKQALEMWLDGCQWGEIAIAVDAHPVTVRLRVKETIDTLAVMEEV